MWTRLKSVLSASVDGASLAVFRVCFGGIMLLEALSLLKPLAQQNLIERFYPGEQVRWLFPFYGFSWVRPWPEPFMTLHCYALALFAVLLALGLYPQIAAAGLFLTWTYVWLLDETLFTNHYYLMSLIAFLMIWMPSGNALSLDRYWEKQEHERDGISVVGTPENVPYWTVFLLRIQLFVLYFFGALAKLSTEWVEHSEPMRTWLARPNASEAIAAYFPGFLSEAMHDAGFAFFMSRGALVFGLLAGFLLWVPRTRLLGLVLVLGFYGIGPFILFNNIGWFPLLGITLATIFFAPDWPRRLWRSIQTRAFPVPNVRWLLAGAIAMPIALIPLASRMPLWASGPFFLLAAATGTTLGWSSSSTSAARAQKMPERQLVPQWMFVCMVGWVLVQFLLPLRHFFIPGDVNWTAEGGRFAWRMKAYQKDLMPLNIRVDDSIILPRDEQGRERPNWNEWAGPKVLYQRVNMFRLDWRTLPEIVVVFEPFHGERVFFNSLAGSLGENPTPQEAAAHVNALWQKHYGHLPQMVVTHSGAEIFDEIDDYLRDKPAVGVLRNSALQARKLADVVPDAMKRSPSTSAVMLVAYRQHLRNLAFDPVHGEPIRKILRNSPPLMSHGGLTADARFVDIHDPLLENRNERGFVSLDREKWKDVWPLSYVVFLDPGAYTDIQRPALPLVFIYRELDGQFHIRWNSAADLQPKQELLMKSQPFLCQQYAQQVASRWMGIYQRRPAVYFDNSVAMAPYAFQRNIDPDTDLASAPLSLFGHNSWIPTIDKTQLRGANDRFLRRTADAD